MSLTVERKENSLILTYKFMKTLFIVLQVLLGLLIIPTISYFVFNSFTAEGLILLFGEVIGLIIITVNSLKTSTVIVRNIDGFTISCESRFNYISRIKVYDDEKPKLIFNKKGLYRYDAELTYIDFMNDKRENLFLLPQISRNTAGLTNKLYASSSDVSKVKDFFSKKYN